MIRLRANLVHFPRVFVKFYAQAGGHTLSLFHQRMQEVTQITKIFFLGKMKTVRQFGERGNRIDRGMKISFDHCAGRASSSATAFRPEEVMSSAASFTSAKGVLVGSNGPIHVAVSSSYCTCVSVWRVPLMNVVPRITKASVKCGK